MPANHTATDEVLAMLEGLRHAAVAQLRFARMVLACWPTIRQALERIDRAREPGEDG